MNILKPNKSGFGYLIESDAGFISPTDERNVKSLNESNLFENDDKKIIKSPLKLIAVLQKYGIKNKNGRVYPENILKKEVTNYEKLIQTGSSVGEAEHPESSIINSSRVSHKITKVWWEGQTLLGEVEIIMTPGYVNYGIISSEGDNIANLLRNQVRVGVSSRGVGSVQEINGILLVQEDFEIICWDIVLNPSTPGSWMFNKKHEADLFIESKKEETKPLLIDGLNNFLMN